MGGIMDYRARFYSPALGRFLQPDTIIPDQFNPQSWNRFSYVRNNPILLIDPTGHNELCGVLIPEEDCQDDPPQDTSGGGGGGGDSPCDEDDDACWLGLNDGGNNGDDQCQEGDICFDWTLRNDCSDSSCQMFATGVALIGTALDISAFVMNLSFAVGADIAALFGGYGAVVLLYRAASFIPNLMGTYGGIMWAIQGILLGDTYLNISGTLSPDFWSNQATASVTFSQDTAVAAVNDTVGWLIPEPNLAAFSSGLGALYDLGRNPLSPYLSSDPPWIPTLIAPTYSVSVDASSFPAISSGWSSLWASP